MSKRVSGQSNTLLNYFQSPKNKSKAENTSGSSSNGNLNLEKLTIESNEAPCITTDNDPPSALMMQSRVTDTDSTSDETPVGKYSPSNRRPKVLTKKRNRIPVVDSDSDGLSARSSDSSTEINPRAKKVKLTENRPSLGDLGEVVEPTKENVAASISKSPITSQNSEAAATTWLHNTLDFLKPEQIRDINRTPSGHPDYDKKTLYVPQDFLNKQTPAMQQWWILKSQHFDTVLFFKVGKFYELYHMDAVIGVNNLGFTYMKGAFAHSGFPESAYGRMASSLIDQDFKVARVEQTETPEMLAKRLKTVKRVGKADKVVAREICQITTKATCIYGAQLTNAKQALPCYMLAVAEKPISGGSRFGVCFVDTSIGIFHIGEFDDDKHCSRMLALFAQHPPGLVLIERGRLQSSTAELLKKTLGNVRRDTLAPTTQFYSAQTAVDNLTKGSYFRSKNNDFRWPAVLQDMIEYERPKIGFELALRTLGACHWYLKDSMLDVYVLSMKKFKLYQPVDTVMDKEGIKRNFMVLDSVTIENLSLLGSTGTLQKTLDYCETAFGKRLLQQWICRPLCVKDRILQRQNAVEELYQNTEVLQAARAILKKLPDFERQVAKLHTFGNKFGSTFHPDSRAVLYEAKTYSKRKIFDLVSTLNGFEKAQELAQVFWGCKSRLLKKLTQYPPNGKFVDLSTSLQFFEDAFDQNQAEREGTIIPQPGLDEEYDRTGRVIAQVKEELEGYLKTQQKFFGCKVTYFGHDKKRFQLEIPENKTHKVTPEYKLEGTKRGAHPVKRYTTSKTREMLADMIHAEEQMMKIVQDLNRRIFEKFSDRRDEWEQSIQCLMVLDVICSFAEYARKGSRIVSFPNIVDIEDKTCINIVDGVHPCTLLEDFVPNSTKLGMDNKANLMLLTGPNMGGKSTLMRQVALIIIMAQMGCSVPASNCEFSLVDRIFTRLGAHDDILQGQSTFLVELGEASAILQHATSQSLVLLDELGRGTSTHDGNAIATAYVCKLSKIQCRAIFSTHYHSLVDHFTNKDGIQLAHMACMTDNDQDGEDDELKSVTLLYQLREGNCPKSYGFNAAKLAGLNKSIINRAREVASHLENVSKTRRFMRSLMLCDDITSIKAILSTLK